MEKTKPISKMKVKELKTELKKRNIEHKGNKDELISKLKTVLDSSFLNDSEEKNRRTNI